MVANALFWLLTLISDYDNLKWIHNVSTHGGETDIDALEWAIEVKKMELKKFC